MAWHGLRSRLHDQLYGKPYHSGSVLPILALFLDILRACGQSTLHEFLNHGGNLKGVGPVPLFVAGISEGIEGAEKPEFLEVADQSRHVLCGANLAMLVKSR